MEGAVPGVVVAKLVGTVTAPVASQRDEPAAADIRPGVGRAGRLGVAQEGAAGLRVVVADASAARDTEVDEVVRPFLPLVGRVMGLDLRPVVVVLLNRDVLL